MCNCTPQNNGQADSLAVAFNNRTGAIQSVFSRYGMAHCPVTPHWALVGAQAHGPEFVADIANSFDGQQAGQIAGIFASAAGFATDLAGNIINWKNQNKGGFIPVQNPVGPASVAPAPAPAPIAPEKKYFGFTVPQIGLLALVVVAVVATVIFTRKK